MRELMKDEKGIKERGNNLFTMTSHANMVAVTGSSYI